MLVADLINALQKRGLSPQLWPAQAQLRDVDLVRACFDSRRVQPGDIFCAIPGHSQQGADFIQSALDAQASMLLVDQVREQFSCPLPRTVRTCSPDDRVQRCGAPLSPVLMVKLRLPI